MVINIQIPSAQPIADEMIDAVDSRIAGKSFTQSGYFFDNYMAGSPLMTGTRNPNAWCADIPDITCMAAWSTAELNIRVATLIAPDIVVTAGHILSSFEIGDSMEFRAMDDTHVVRTIASKMMVAPDIAIMRLNSPVSDNIHFAQILPSYINTSLEALVADGLKIPVMYSNQQSVMGVADWFPPAHLQLTGAQNAPTDSKRLEFNGNLIGGDSGRPCFAIYRGRLALRYVLTSAIGPLADGSSIVFYRKSINAGMTSLGSQYQLTEMTIR